nr:angiopoietin-1 [Drosophila bipectinata]
MSITDLEEKINNYQRKIIKKRKQLGKLEKLVSLYRGKCKDKDDLISFNDKTIKLLKNKIAMLQTTLDESEKNNLDNNWRKNAKDFQTLQEKIEIMEAKAKNNEIALNQQISNVAVLETKIKEKDIMIGELEDRAKSYEVKIMEMENHASPKDRAIEGSKVLPSKVKLLEKTISEKDAIIAKLKFDPKKDYTFYYNGRVKENLSNKGKTKMKLFDWGFDNFVLSLQILEGTGTKHWLVIQNRFMGKLNINPLTNFEAPIGCPDLEFWIGFERLHILTTIRRHELYIELTNYEDEKKYARYDNFVVDGKESGYKLSALGEYEGNAGDALRHHVNQKTHYQIGDTNSVSREMRWWKGPREKGGNLNVPLYIRNTSINWYGKPYKRSKMMIRLYED